MHLIDAYTLLASNRTLLLTLLFLLIPGFGLFVASLYLTRENVRWRFFFGRSLPFNWKGLAILLNVTSLALLLAAACS